MAGARGDAEVAEEVVLLDACGPSTIVDASCAKRRLRVFLLRDGGVGFSGRDCVGLGGQRERAGVTRNPALRDEAGRRT